MSFWRTTGDSHAPDTRQLRDAGYTLGAGPTVDGQLTVLDDFDWRIWRSGFLLIRRSEGPLELHQGPSPVAAAKAEPGCRSWRQLPSGDLAQRLRRLTGVRAFVPKYTCQMKTQEHSLLNKDEKIVARLRVCSLSGSQPAPLDYIEVVSLRGYQEDYQHITQLMQQAGAQQIEAQGLRELVPLSGMPVEFVPSKPSFNLDAQEPAAPALLRMLAILVEVARHYETGIVQDIDTECVHQHRVNLRKARSLISLFKKSFSTECYQKLRSGLKTLGAMTNELRDLDVFLLDFDGYAHLLPTDFRAGLLEVFGHVQCRRNQVFKQTIKCLATPHHETRVAELMSILKAKPELEAPSAKTSIKELVQAKVRKQYRKIRRPGLTTQRDTPDKAIHRMRIDCKKLRYLLELFAELFSPDQLKRPVRRLKQLQDNLGRFNDYALQGRFLRAHIEASDLSAAQLASANGLLAVLHNRQCDERSRIEGNIAAFTTKQVRRQFRQLCPDKPEEDA